MNRALKLLALLTGLAFMSAPGANPAAAASSTQDVPERWQFEFDSRRWQLGHQVATSEQAIREYVLSGETVEAWSELVTSFSVATDKTMKDWFTGFQVFMSKDCPSFRLSPIEESANSMLFEWQHQGCRGFPPQHELKRVVQVGGGILFLSYVAKTANLSDERRSSWISILRAAAPVIQPVPALLGDAESVPGSSLVNHAAALRKDVLANLATFVKEKYGCESVGVVDTISEGPKKGGSTTIYFDGEGRGAR